MTDALTPEPRFDDVYYQSANLMEDTSMTNRLTPEENRQICEWAGFKQGTGDSTWFLRGEEGSGGWKYPDGTVHGSLPDLSNDFNPHVKWTIPKLRDKGYAIRILIDISSRVVLGDEEQPLVLGVTQWYEPALALSRTILQDIEKEVK